jgi:gamma-glutamyltranspeptidase/glutathione hydrolase
MMAPTIADDGRCAVALGSGGSNRLRTAILQVLVNILDFSMPLADAIDAPRVHFENGLLNIENGFDPIDTDRINPVVNDLKMWQSRNLFFGGVHGVRRDGDTITAKGDPRRGGHSVTI